MDYGDTMHQLQVEELDDSAVSGKDLNLDWSFHLFSGKPVRGLDQEIDLSDYFEMNGMLQKIIKTSPTDVY